MKKLGVFITVILGWLCMAVPAHADVQDFTINDFKANYFLSNEDPQGLLAVNEALTVTFTDNNHGILRAIPNSYNGRSLKLKIAYVSSDSGAPTTYTTYQENGNTVLKIGDPNKTVTGRQQYNINYTVLNVIGFYDGYAELYWDVNGDQWQQPLEHVSVSLETETGANLIEAVCYTGGFGSKAQDCATKIAGNQLNVETTASLGAGQTLTFAAKFRSAYFAPETTVERLRDYLGTILKISLPLLLAGGYAVRRWLKYGRDPKGRGTIVPEYDAPYNLLPAEVGTLADFRTDQKDITATILDLAVRGYLKIIEEKKVKRLARDSLEYSLELRRTDWGGLSDYEQKILSGIFGSGAKMGDVQALKDMKNKFYKTASEVQELVINRMIAGGYLRGKPSTAGVRLWLLFLLLLFAAVILGSWLGGAVILGFALAAVVVFITALAMPARTAAGVDAKDKALGLKLYMETAEKDRLTMLQAPDARYAANKSEPKKTVDLFEKLLPYAIIYGVEKQWAAEFKDIYKTQPAWYGGTPGNFSSVYLASALTGSMGSSMNSAFASPTSSGGSGFGGGSAGGGGGGGGGGGW